MLIKNIRIFTEEKNFSEGMILMRGDRIAGIYRPGEENELFPGSEAEETIDGAGSYAVPGMIDMHFHGCAGFDFCDGTPEALDGIAEYEASVGVTAFSPATMTLPAAELVRILENAAKFCREQAGGKTAGRAELVGINMEGPFISAARKGAQEEAYILPCDAAMFERFLCVSEGLVKVIGVAPEKEGALPFIRAVKDRAVVSLAHTDAGYEAATAALDAGADHAVHLYNAMRGFSHREPGTVGAVFDSATATAELICDGVHVHPAAVRSALKLLGPDRVIFVSDSMRAAGMKDGIYTLGGHEVRVQGKRAELLSDHSLAGSVSTLPDCVRTAVKQMGVPLETAIACATANPARRLGIYGEYGSITVGKKADVVLLDNNLQLICVIKNGKILKNIKTTGTL